MRVFVFFAAVATVLMLHAPARADDAAPATLTVIGKVGTSNRPGFDPFRDAFFKFHGKEFEKAFAFDRAALKALPQRTVTAKAAPWPKPVTASGPPLKDVLDAAGVADDATVTLFALDGYGVTLSPADRAARDWVLAIEMDGTPLAIGGRGPAWLLYDTGDGTASEDAEAKWVWSVFVIAAE
ncbi:molybdopterin-dependent oxidoreductase [Rhodobium gokarnense]|uniref:Oxidoreductase molybdopterin-binding domain-containing protein n=1 Tax=Rhodobium gokarnense TaxID=364296 RepID=A0ABT3H9E9_9HYPH|nr:molybdopterin-dependent oxidoreductase [Rhodobium gokarnense]MCW2307022.1 hypothetical protein [Rhodobium gokarnense]